MAKNTNDNQQQRDRRPRMERHLQTFLLAVSIGLVGWFGNKVASLSETTILTKAAVDNTGVQVAELKTDITNVRDQLREFYLRADADRVHADLTNWLRRHDQRLLELERGAIK